MEAPIELSGGESAVLIAGPTASGKSALALSLAERLAKAGRHTIIVNADSMQVYDPLRVLTARPMPQEEARAPHRLYGHASPDTRYSVGAYLGDAEAVIREAQEADALPIFVGGTGLYFKALTEGLTETPPVPMEIRSKWATFSKQHGPAALHAALAERDPASADILRPSDPQRLLRALEVIEATGMPLREWQARQSSQPLIDRETARSFVAELERPLLYARIERRFDRMVEEGALEEVEQLLARGLDPTLPAMKAIGVREFAAFLAGSMSLDEAIARAKMETRRYAKRQMTWFRNQMPDWERVRVGA